MKKQRRGITTAVVVYGGSFMRALRSVMFDLRSLSISKAPHGIFIDAFGATPAVPATCLVPAAVIQNNQKKKSHWWWTHIFSQQVQQKVTTASWSGGRTALAKWRIMPEFLAALLAMEQVPDRLRESPSTSEPIVSEGLLLPFSVLCVPLKHLPSAQAWVLLLPHTANMERSGLVTAHKSLR